MAADAMAPCGAQAVKSHSINYVRNVDQCRHAEGSNPLCLSKISEIIC